MCCCCSPSISCWEVIRTELGWGQGTQEVRVCSRHRRQSTVRRFRTAGAPRGTHDQQVLPLPPSTSRPSRARMGRNACSQDRSAPMGHNACSQDRSAATRGEAAAPVSGWREKSAKALLAPQFRPWWPPAGLPGSQGSSADVEQGFYLRGFSGTASKEETGVRGRFCSARYRTHLSHRAMGIWVREHVIASKGKTLKC